MLLAGEQDAMKVKLILGITHEYSAAQVSRGPHYKWISPIKLALKGREFEGLGKAQKVHQEYGAEKKTTGNKREP